jgi:putative toxin of predicted polymorphic toxin system
LSRSIPFFGAAIALLTLGGAIRRKGFLRGAADTALNAMPFVGGAKTAVEVVRGRDLFADRRAGL